MYQKTYQIKGCPIIKFQSRERLESLQKGLVYANTLSYYRKLEKQTGDTAVGDSFEGLFHVNEGIMIIPETGDKFVLNDELIKTSASNDYVFCMFGILDNTECFQFSDEQRERMKSFGDSALIILDSNEFVNRVKKAAEAEEYVVHFGKVNYIEPNIDYVDVMMSLREGMWRVAFYKRAMYKYQNECRFIFSPGKAGVEHLELHIGDISDISVILSVENALNGMLKERH